MGLCPVLGRGLLETLMVDVGKLRHNTVKINSMSASSKSSSFIPSLDAVWRASELGGVTCSTVPSGYAELDAELPGAGWPLGAVTEVLQHQPGVHEWRLLVPGLRARLAVSSWQMPQALVLIGSPHWSNLPALACQGIPVRSVLVVEASQPAERLWAAEQALRCRDLAALMLWTPQVRPAQLRRLQVAAQGVKSSAGPSGGRAPPLVFVFRPAMAQYESSPAPLRVGLRMAPQGVLAVDVFKRRGPPLETPVLLTTEPLPALAHHHHLPREIPDQATDLHTHHHATLNPALTHVVDSPFSLARPVASNPSDQHLVA